MLLLVFIGGAGTAARSSDGQTGGLRGEMEALLRRGASAWNRGDLGAFMSDYLDSDRTTYVGRTGVLRGRAAIRQSYASRYFAPGAARDSLSFEKIQVDSLAPGVAHVIAYYVLTRGDSVTARGPTSLTLVRVGGRWLIVHDHSS